MKKQVPRKSSDHDRLMFTHKEVAAKLGLSTCTIRRAIARGLIRPVRLFRHIRFTAAELQRFVDEATTGRVK